MIVAAITASPSRLVLAAIIGIVLLLVLIMKCKIHPVLALLICALFIGLVSGMSVNDLMDVVEDGAGETMGGLILLIGLGAMFGGIIETSGGAQSFAQTLIDKLGEKKSGLALGITGLVVGATVFFDAGVMVLISLVYGLAKKTGKSTLTYAVPMMAGILGGFLFIPPSTAAVVGASLFGADLGMMIALGIPLAVIVMLVAGVLFSKFVDKRMFAELPDHIRDKKEEEGGEQEKLPKFSTVLAMILIPLLLILSKTIVSYIPALAPAQPFFDFIGEPFVALLIAIFFALVFLGLRMGYKMDQLKEVLTASLKPVGMILMVITGGGIIQYVMQESGIGEVIGTAMGNTGLPVVLVAFLISGLMRIAIGPSVVAITMAAGIITAMPVMATLSSMQTAAVIIAVLSGSAIISHVNDSGFWLFGSLLQLDEKQTFRSWTVLVTIVGLVGLVYALVISLIAG